MRAPLLTRSLGVVLAAGLAFAMANRPPIHASPAPEPLLGGFGGAEAEPAEPGLVVHLAAKPMSPEAAKVWLKLQQKPDMAFPNDTPLEDVVKYVQRATADPQDFSEGIPVYVDPQGLQDADKTMASTVSIHLKGIPLATTLALTLKQLGLEYRLHKDGMLFITATGSGDSPAEAEALILDNLSALRAEVKALREEVRGLRGGSHEHQPPPPPAGVGGGMGSKGGMM